MITFKMNSGFIFSADYSNERATHTKIFIYASTDTLNVGDFTYCRKRHCSFTKVRVFEA